MLWGAFLINTGSSNMSVSCGTSSAGCPPILSRCTSRHLLYLSWIPSIGVYQQLAELPHPEAIETLDLTCEPVYETRLDTVCPILLRLTNLTSLDIWTHVFDINADHSQFFISVLSSCPKLTDFHFMCTTSFTVVRMFLSGYLPHTDFMP